MLSSCISPPCNTHENNMAIITVPSPLGALSRDVPYSGTNSSPNPTSTCRACNYYFSKIIQQLMPTIHYTQYTSTILLQDQKYGTQYKWCSKKGESSPLAQVTYFAVYCDITGWCSSCDEAIPCRDSGRWSYICGLSCTRAIKDIIVSW